MRQKPINLVFLVEDVEKSISMMEKAKETHPLQLNEVLCEHALEEKKGSNKEIFQFDMEEQDCEDKGWKQNSDKK